MNYLMLLLRIIPPRRDQIMIMKAAWTLFCRGIYDQFQDYVS